VSATPLLAVEQVSKRFGDLQAVDRVSFEVRPGEVLGFLGPNGAGKTTTLRMLMEITRPDSGRVLWEGRPAIDRRRIGYLPEERGLFEDARLLDTLVYLGSLRGMSRAAAREEGRRWLERLQLAERVNAKLNTLSKGNQQKVQLAGAILHGPALAVLDEPFSGLDPLNQELFLDIVREMRDRGVAVLLSAHQLNLVERLCDRFHLIARGRGVLEGTLDEIRRRAARGAAEVLVIELRGASGLDQATLGPQVRAAAPDAEFRIRPGAGGATLEISLREGVDLSPILAALSARHRVERVQTRALSLHEIYLRAVSGDLGAVPNEETAVVTA
jgi:ABC-2 type transport system ATP-binding protein